VARYLIPFRRPGGKSRLGDPELALCMARDVSAACRAVSGDPLLVTASGGLSGAVADALGALQGGPVTIVNADLPCATPEELEELTGAAPALVAAADGTTNALALGDRDDFVPLYGPGSAARFEAALGATRLSLAGLEHDVDTWGDLERVRDRVGAHTRGYLRTLVRA
jgi:2-phospho-L-lactate guanylyltransferase (CobY/MobA/RfbA family)